MVRIIEKPGRVTREEREMRRRRVDCRADRNFQILVLNMKLRRSRADWAPKVAHPPHRLILLELGRYLDHPDHTDAHDERRWRHWGGSCEGFGATTRKDRLVCGPCSEWNDHGDEWNDYGKRKSALGGPKRGRCRRGRANSVEQSGCGCGRAGGTGGGVGCEESLRRQQRI